MHFRIRHDRSHRDDDAMIVRVGWDCTVCGAENEVDDSFCWVCSTERGDWLCERCAHKNKKRETACEECGVAKADQ